MPRGDADISNGHVRGTARRACPCHDRARTVSHGCPLDSPSLPMGLCVNFQQLRAVQEAIRQDFNLTATAEATHASQSAVSRQIRELEEELGIGIFHRNGKRLTGLTEAGSKVVDIIERILTERIRLRQAAESLRLPSADLSVAATHAQVRYRLPGIILAFRDRHPSVRLSLHQTTPVQVIEMIERGQADIGLITEGLPRPADIVTFRAYSWGHLFIAPVGHPLLAMRMPSFADIARYPIITFEKGMVGRENIEEAFRRQGLVPDIIISAVDSDVIKTYVALGLGIGIIAERSFDPAIDHNLAVIGTDALISPVTTSVAVRRGTPLQDHAIAFILNLVPTMSADHVRESVESPPVPAASVRRA